MSKNLQTLLDEQAKLHWHAHYQVSDETRAKTSGSLKGKKTWNKGIPHTDQAKANISKSKKGKPNPRKCKPMMTPNGVFPSAKAVATAGSVSYVTVWNWMKRWPEHYYYLEV